MPIPQPRKVCVNEIFLSIHKYLRASCGASLSGTTNSAGLPELEGTFTVTHVYDSYLVRAAGSNGVFSWTVSNKKHLAEGRSSGRSLQTLSFSASNGNSIYGNSTTVMPESINISICIYLGRSS